MRSQTQHALTQDVESWPARFGVGRTDLWINAMHSDEVAEGLDERGDASSPYAPGSKPPSIRSADERRASTRIGRVGEEMSGETNNPPGYHEHPSRSPEESLAQVTRPPAAVNLCGSLRILLAVLNVLPF